MSRALIITLAVAGVVLLLMVVSFVALEQPVTCGICHDEKTIVDSWRTTPMGKKNVICMDCHSDSGFLARVGTHIRGAAYLIAGERTKKADVPTERCLMCHFAYKTASEQETAAKHYNYYMKPGTTCQDCHLQMAHVVLDKKSLPKTVADGWAGVDVCKKCHERTFMRWEEESRHAEAMQTLQPKNIANDRCLGCHTVGYKKKGFVSLEKTPKLGSVQCENCHGKGEKHIQQPKANNVPKASLAAKMCGECHSGSHHNTFSDAEWKSTKHAAALKTLVDMDKKTPGVVKNECLLCHSADYILAPEDKKPTLKTAKETLTCPACHDGHSTRTRLPKEELCQSCHQAENLKVGDAVHHPTKEMYLGKVIPGSGVFGPPVSKHVLNAIACPNCHMIQQPYVSEEQPAKTGHDFMPKPEGCVKCHNAWTTDVAAAKIAELQAPTKAALDELKPRVDAAKAKYKELSNNGKKKVKDNIKKPYDLLVLGYDIVAQDSSNGFHNPEYAARMIDLCRTNLPVFEAAVK
ncbi:MAG: cytochrome c3 family protein [Actinomycetota bacterium]